MKSLYDRYMETTTPEQRAKLEKDGLAVEPPGARVKKRAQNETEIQAVRLQRLMERIDEPIEMPEDKGDIYAVPWRKRHIQKPTTGQTDTDGFHHVYRLNRTKEVAKQKMMERRAEELVEYMEDQESRLQLIQKEDAITAKKAARRRQRKQNKKGVSKKEAQE